jgi:patatin-related protein
VELKDNNKIDQKLVKWGQLDQREIVENPQSQGHKLYFVDGGVLDNRPFSYTIKEMYYRTINRPVDRKLFYIDPSPDRFIDQDGFQNISKPNTLQIIQDSLIGIPMYESIGNDLEAIKSHNEKVRRYKTLLTDTQTSNDSTMATLEAIDIKETIYLRSRLISLRDRVLPLILRMEQNFRLDPEKKAYLDKAANILTDQVTGEKEKEKRDKIRQAFERQVRNLDVEYSLRKHFYLVQILCQRLETESNLFEYQKIRYLSESISRQIKLLEVIRAALNQLLSKPIVSESFYQLLAQPKPDHQTRGLFYERLLRLHRFLLDAVGLENFSPDEGSDLEAIPANIFQNLPLKATEPLYDEWLSQRRISSILLQFRQKINKLQNQQDVEERIWKNSAFNYDNQENEYFETILRQVELASEALIETSQLSAYAEILRDFQQFRYLDKVLYPFEYLMDLTEKELIETIRISPNDATLGLGEGKTLEDKLAGDTLFAFGGFFKKSWRSNDILWGRLDGLNRIFEALLTPEAVKRFPDFLARQGNCRRGTPEFEAFTNHYLEFLLNESLPNILETERTQIIRYLRKLRTPEKLTEKQLKLTIDELLRTVVLEGHREIVNTDLTNVLQDEIAEQLNWNRQRVQPKSSAKNRVESTNIDEEARPQYHPVGGYFDRNVSALAASRLAEEAVINLSQGNTERFFREKYNVGQETVLDGIPRIILANISTQFALVLRNVVLTALGRRSSILRKSLTYNIFDKSLQLFYGWLQFTGPLAVQTSKYRPIFLILQLILLLVAIAGVAIVVSQSWVWVMIALSATLLFWVAGDYSERASREISDRTYK